MLFERILPPAELENYIECYWVMEDEDPTPKLQKIIPDGFTEIIFHYGDRFRININKRWDVQAKSLLAGQLKKYFFLENTGRSSIVGIKFKPAALTPIFGIPMYSVTDKVIPLQNFNIGKLASLEKKVKGLPDHHQVIFAINDYLRKIIPGPEVEKSPVEDAIEMIFASKGTISINELIKKLFLSERRLQRLFKTYIGLSPKFYARIIRFNQIFNLMKEEDVSWVDLTYEAGYFDQSHFIRNFKSFTGEDPTRYAFNDPNMANFFLMKTGS